jgi:hypothetical protein
MNYSTKSMAGQLIIFSGPAKLYEIRGYSTIAQFILIYDRATAPGINVKADIVLKVAADANFSLSYNRGRSFLNGIVICNSSTAPTKTVNIDSYLVDIQFE